jgi:protein-S-isoprenylcysteine O-methyltransferase Ste14
MYFGYLLVHVGFLLLNPSLWNVTVYVLAYALQVPRLLVEERLLARDQAYAQYQRQVRFRLIPGVF